MNGMKQLLYIGGFYHLGFAAFHLLFWNLFRWRDDLRSLNFINRNVMQILNLRLIYVFLVVAWLSIYFAETLLSGGIGTALMIAVALFWLMRAVEQVVFFGLRHLVSQIMFVLFMAGAALYAYPVWLRLK